MKRDEQTRKKKIAKIYNTILDAKKQGVGINKNKIIAIMGLDIGISRRTVMEYIRTLVDSDQILEEKDDNGETILWIK